MSSPYIGEIRMFSFGRTPNGWQVCDGSLLPIAEYDALFALIGTTYGGNGQTTFGVPDLRGRVPVAVTRRRNSLALIQRANAQHFEIIRLVRARDLPALQALMRAHNLSPPAAPG